MREYKETYKGLIICLVLLSGTYLGVLSLHTTNYDILNFIISNIMTVAIAILTYIIYKNEKIYWYLGVTYEDAKEATPKQRGEFALKHCKRFIALAVVCFVFYAFAIYYHIHDGWMDLYGIFIYCIVAISMIRIKLEIK